MKIMRKFYMNFLISVLLLLSFFMHYYLYRELRSKLVERHEKADVSKDIREIVKGQGNLISRIYPDFHRCRDTKSRKRFEQKGHFWVLKNYITATKEFHCNETITYTTHGEFPFLDNVVVLAERWQGPISVAVYSPGSDFEDAVKAIIYLRNCVSQQVKDLVTFHLYFESEHFPPKIRDPDYFQIECSDSYEFEESKVTYRKTKGLLYPVNVGRNIARTSARTYFVFASDIELYPSINIIPEFLKMIERSDYTESLNKRVFVLPIFEVKKGSEVPKTKEELISMLRTKDAIWFHENICKNCHRPPAAEKWKDSKINPGLSVLKIGKRTESFRAWEPFYIGTNYEPIFDERLSSEGRANKMTQAYAMCLLGYEYHVLDNAFIVHKPGIKRPNVKILFSDLVEKQNELIFNTIVKEYKKYYGDRKECNVMGKPSKKLFEKMRSKNDKNT